MADYIKREKPPMKAYDYNAYTENEHQREQREQPDRD